MIMYLWHELSDIAARWSLVRWEIVMKGAKG